ncbi:MAG: DUF4442 domain-containing protein [Deltaproteobacteria bacterium]|nr:DUF4442 domain-containing protein [Deltaproteobacteria bacterium]MBI2499990.1 DUF4442 domain-containing protein [Deltaproteobacteria bacterium]
MSFFKATWYLRLFGLIKVPLIFLVRPKVLDLSEKRCEIRIPLNYLTRNHFKSMYFGTLAIGADCAGGLMTMSLIKKSGKNISIIFKDYKAEFLKRAEADTHFICEEGEKIHQLIEETIRTGERVSQPINMTATCPKKFGPEPVARFVLTLSLKITS